MKKISPIYLQNKGAMNKSLTSLYISKLDLLKKNLKDILADELEAIKPANPLLISINDEQAYSSADIRVMIFGQETNLWCSEVDNFQIEEIQNAYKSWFYDGHARSYGGFYRGLFRFNELLKQKFPTKNIEIIWNNLSKIGRLQGRGPQSEKIQNHENNYFNVIEEEIKILKPNLNLFLTGPDRDYLINQRLNAYSFKPVKNYNIRKLAKIEDLLNIPSFRTYHTQYLGFSKKTDEYFNAIIDELSF